MPVQNISPHTLPTKKRGADKQTTNPHATNEPAMDRNQVRQARELARKQ